MYASRSFCRDVRVDLAAPFAGEESQKFICSLIQLVVAVGAAVGNSRDYSDKLVRVLSTHLCKSAFLLSVSLPDAVKSDYAAVIVKLGAAFGLRWFMDRFRATIYERGRLVKAWRSMLLP